MAESGGEATRDFQCCGVNAYHGHLTTAFHAEQSQKAP